MRFDPVLATLVRHHCRFVVVGSAARALGGEPVRPNDLDLVIDATAVRRPALVAALRELGASGRLGHRLVPIAELPSLPWGWTAVTPVGDVDVIARFADGTTIDEHEGDAMTAVLSSDGVVRCARAAR